MLVDAVAYRHRQFDVHCAALGHRDGVHGFEADFSVHGNFVFYGQLAVVSLSGFAFEGNVVQGSFAEFYRGFSGVADVVEHECFSVVLKPSVLRVGQVDELGEHDCEAFHVVKGDAVHGRLLYFEEELELAGFGCRPDHFQPLHVFVNVVDVEVKLRFGRYGCIKVEHSSGLYLKGLSLKFFRHDIVIFQHFV